MKSKKIRATSSLITTFVNFIFKFEIASHTQLFFERQNSALQTFAIMFLANFAPVYQFWQIFDSFLQSLTNLKT